MTNLAAVLKELQQERSRLDEAIRVIGAARVRQSHGSEKDETEALGSGAREDSRGPEGPLGEGEGSEGVPAGPHHEQGRAQQDSRSTARAVGQDEGTAEEGRLSSVILREQKARANRAFYPELDE